MRVVLVLALFLAVAPAAAAAWIQIPPKRSCGPLPDGYVCSTKTQVSFGYPASWNAFAYNDGGLYRRSLVWLGTEPFHGACTTTTDGMTTTVVCRPPIGSLRPNGVAATWYVGGLRGVEVLPGEFTTIAGLPAKVNVVAGGCPELGGDEVISAWVETRRHHAIYNFRACLRGPDLASLESQVHNVLASARFPLG